MDELNRILSHWKETGGVLEGCVLATVVHVRGSAYRRPGARMLIGSDGTRIGTVSGGCLETEVVRKAWWWTTGGPSVRVFDNTTEDAARDFGLGCNGQITVLVERATDVRARRLLAFLEDHQRRREAVVVATTISATPGSGWQIGDRVMFGPDGSVHEDAVPAVHEQVAAAARAALDERCSRLLHLPDADVFVELVAPAKRLFVFGAGHDAIPLSSFAGLMGWELTIASTRVSELTPERFPQARTLFPVPHSGDISALKIGCGDAVVLMSHNFADDARLLPQLLDAAPRYLGMLGPRRRAEKLFAEVGRGPGAVQVHAPVGLDIGGDDPEAIALSIVAEVQAVFANAEGGFLRRRRGPIHLPSLEVDADAVSPQREIAPEPVACGLAASA